MGKGAFITPRTLPTATETFQLEVPNQPEYRAILRGFFLDLADPANWNQATSSVTAAQAAQWAEIILQSLEDDVPCL
jgi:hypothetical protein